MKVYEINCIYNYILKVAETGREISEIFNQESERSFFIFIDHDEYGVLTSVEDVTPSVQVFKKIKKVINCNQIQAISIFYIKNDLKTKNGDLSKFNREKLLIH